MGMAVSRCTTARILTISLQRSPYRGSEDGVNPDRRAAFASTRLRDSRADCSSEREEEKGAGAACVTAPAPFLSLASSCMFRIACPRDRGRHWLAAAGNSMLTGVSSPARMVTSLVTTCGLLPRMISALSV